MGMAKCFYQGTVTFAMFARERNFAISSPTYDKFSHGEKMSRKSPQTFRDNTEL